MNGYLVNLGQLTTMVDEITQCGDAIGSIQGKIDSASLPPQSWGLLGLQLGLLDHYQSLFVGLEDRLQQLNKTTHNAADVLRRTADSYSALEDKLRKRFDHVTKPPRRHDKNRLAEIPTATRLQTFHHGYLIGDNQQNNHANTVSKNLTALGVDVAEFAVDAVHATADPLATLLEHGLAFLESVLSPLRNAINFVTGNPTALSLTATKFDRAAAEITEIGQRVTQIATNNAEHWQGKAAATAGQGLGDTGHTITITAADVSNVATTLQTSSLLMQAAHDIVNGIVADVVSQLVIIWLAAQAAAFFTFGASEAVAATATVITISKATERAEQIVSQVDGLLERIMELLAKMKES